MKLSSQNEVPESAVDVITTETLLRRAISGRPAGAVHLASPYLPAVLLLLLIPLTTF